MMECRFSFKHMDTSPALSTYAKEKIVAKIEKFSTKPIEVHITFSVEHHAHHTHVNVFGGDGFQIQVDAESPDMYTSVDLVVDKLEIQLKKRKERLKNHHVKPVPDDHVVSIQEEDDPLISDDRFAHGEEPIDAKEIIRSESMNKTVKKTAKK